jgi:hypothetical protein
MPLGLFAKTLILYGGVATGRDCAVVGTEAIDHPISRAQAANELVSIFFLARFFMSGFLLENKRGETRLTL